MEGDGEELFVPSTKLCGCLTKPGSKNAEDISLKQLLFSLIKCVLRAAQPHHRTSSLPLHLLLLLVQENAERNTETPSVGI